MNTRPPSPARFSISWRKATSTAGDGGLVFMADRKSTRLNSSHSQISYAVFCLKKKKTHSTTGSFLPRHTPAHMTPLSPSHSRRPRLCLPATRPHAQLLSSYHHRLPLSTHSTAP